MRQQASEFFSHRNLLAGRVPDPTIERRRSSTSDGATDNAALNAPHAGGFGRPSLGRTGENDFSATASAGSVPSTINNDCADQIRNRDPGARLHLPQWQARTRASLLLRPGCRRTVIRVCRRPAYRARAWSTCSALASIQCFSRSRGVARRGVVGMLHADDSGEFTDRVYEHCRGAVRISSRDGVGPPHPPVARAANPRPGPAAT